MSATLTWGSLNTSVGDPSVIGGTSGGAWSAVRGFIDQHAPALGKSEFGMDTLKRTMRGIQPNKAAFEAGLAQGQTYTFNSVTYYLQTWQCDDHPQHPAFTLLYKGLIGGIPTPKADGQNIELSVTIGASDVTIGHDDKGNINSGYQSARREIRYVGRSTKTRYISTTRPTSGTYGVDVSTGPTIISSLITAVEYIPIYYPSGTTNFEDFPPVTANRTYSGALAPVGLVSALTPATVTLSFPECTPVFGSPYFECTDNATLLYAGN